MTDRSSRWIGVAVWQRVNRVCDLEAGGHDGGESVLFGGSVSEVLEVPWEGLPHSLKIYPKLSPQKERPLKALRVFLRAPRSWSTREGTSSGIN